MTIARRTALAGLAATAIAARMAPVRSQGLTKLTFGTNWLAEAEHGGFYQAAATGLYKKHGLDVTIRMGGPGINGVQVLVGHVVDLQMASGNADGLNAVQNGIPIIAVAAFFQKDPQCLISHPGAGADTLAEMKGKPIMISAGARESYWLFLKAKYGFTDDQIRPYNFSMAPFLADPKAIQQGYVTSEPYQIEKESHQKPVVNLLADNGYDNYSTLVLARNEMVDKQPEIVRAFIEASIEGWSSYLNGDPKPGNDMILAANKDMTQDVLDTSIKLMKQYGLVESGDAKTLGIGAMTDARWKSFFDSSVAEGIYPASLDYKKAYTLAFVDQKYGLAK
jgi:NitT/TauT family transport system substrate-binding protein